jgi:hypothetical protein
VKSGTSIFRDKFSSKENGKISSFRDCVEDHLKNRRVPRRKIKAALDRYDKLRDAFIDEGVNPADAEARAGDQVTRETLIRLKEDERRKTAQALKSIELQSTFQRSDIDATPGQRLKALVSPRAGTPIQSYETLRDVYRGLIYSRMSDVIEQFGAKGLGVIHSEKGLYNVVRELFGQDTGDAAAKQLAASWKAATDLSVDLFRQVGGALLKREDWLIGQRQSPARMAKAGKQTWIKDHLVWLDWGRIRRPDGSLVMPAEREQYLSDVFDTIKTGGANKIFGGKQRRGATGNQLDASRELIFKDADSWLAMHEKYQDGNVFDVMTSHVESRAHHIAMMKQFGPSPEQGAEIAKGIARQVAAQRDIADDTARVPAVERLEDDAAAFDDLMTRATRAASGSAENRIAAGAALTRNVLTSAMLGSASLIAIPGDLINAAHVRAFNKMSLKVGMADYMKMLNPLDNVDRDIARRAGFVHESAVALAYTAERFSALAATGPKWGRRMADTVLRASLLSGHTQAARFATQTEMLGLLARFRDESFDDLPFREMLKQNDISARDWDEMRAVPLWEPKPGATFMRPSDVFQHLGNTRRAHDLHDKFMGLAVSTSKEMVPEATIESATTLRGATRSGTPIGEVANSLAMFKSFPVTFVNIHLRKMLTRDSKFGRATYLGALIGGMTMAGAMATQMREITQGRDPQDVDSTSFWLTAMLRGGGLGIYGDVLFAGFNRPDGLNDMAAGPLLDTIGEGLNLTFGNLYEAIQGEDANALPEMIRFAKDITPGHSIWYGRLLFQRLIFERLMYEVDPRAMARAKRRQERFAEENDTGFWFEPGDTAPERAPNF